MPICLRFRKPQQRSVFRPLSGIENTFPFFGNFAVAEVFALHASLWREIKNAKEARVMKTFTKTLIASAGVFALLAGAAVAQQPTQQDTKSGSQTSPADKSGSQPIAGSGGATASPSKQDKGGTDTQDVEKKAQQGAKENMASPAKGGVATKSDTPMTGTQDNEKKAQQGNTPAKGN
jgi:hypothetical protein